MKSLQKIVWNYYENTPQLIHFNVFDKYLFCLKVYLKKNYLKSLKKKDVWELIELVTVGNVSWYNMSICKQIAPVYWTEWEFKVHIPWLLA